jgi:hypothetical protein
MGGLLMKGKTAQAVLVLFLCALSPAAFAGNCGVCHGEKQSAFLRSVHRIYDLYCTDCHGGNSALDVMTLTGKNRTSACKDHPTFKGKIEATKLTELCGGCHSDVERMRPFRIPTDQLAHYRLSLHGKALYERGDGNTATCASCHGIHEILRVKDPRSPAHRWNIPKTCTSCHGDAELMGRYDLPSDPGVRYAAGVHGEGLLQKKLPGVPTCADCHGIHGAAPPGVKQVENMCGYCHVSSKKAFDESPHKEIADRGEMDACITCHGAHEVRTPSRTWFLSDEAGGCLSCHKPDDEGGRAAKEIFDGIRNLERELLAVGERVREAKDIGLFVHDERTYLEEAKRLLVSLQPVTHTASLAKLRGFLTRGAGVVEKTQESIQAKQRVWRDRKIGGAVASGGFLLLAGFLFAGLRIGLRYRRGAPGCGTPPGREPARENGGDHVRDQ